MNISQEFKVNTQRIDELPVLLAQCQLMGLQKLIEKHFATHGNWQGLSLGWVVVVWLCHIISQQDHRLFYVQGWVEKRLQTIRGCTGQTLRELDWSDDRLAASLRYLSQDKNWEEFERELGGNIVQVYEIETNKVYLDSTTSSSYCGVNESGLLQWGKSKDHRPDLRQVKIMLSTLEPIGMPVATEIVAGNKADDPLYIPAVNRVRKTLNKSGLLYVGDCKMAALSTRAEINRGGDYYLCPLSAKQVNDEELTELVMKVWLGRQPTTNVEYDYSNGKRETIALGYQTEVKISAFLEEELIKKEHTCWQERRLVVRSIKGAKREELALRSRLDKAQLALSELGQPRQGKKPLKTLEDWQKAGQKIIKRYRVQELLELDYQVETQTRAIRKHGKRPARVEEKTTITLSVNLNESALDKALYLCGWRVYATNHPTETFTLNDAVVAYRENYSIERDFRRLKNAPLSLTPMYLQRDDHIKGLIRLLSLGLRVLTLLEWKVRHKLSQQKKTICGLYPGNPKRDTARPTAEKLLLAFADITLSLIVTNETTYLHLNPLTSLQQTILSLLDLTTDIYTQLAVSNTQPP
ncbi:MAG: IS1634 family transposase [Symploca sp. SIO2G7]|nr:IS1634 family transposase [Symploca sp. SIO2G7]